MKRMRMTMMVVMEVVAVVMEVVEALITLAVTIVTKTRMAMTLDPLAKGKDTAVNHVNHQASTQAQTILRSLVN